MLPVVLSILCLVTINYFCSSNITLNLLYSCVSLIHTVVSRCEDGRCFPMTRVCQAILILFSKQAWTLDFWLNFRHKLIQKLDVGCHNKTKFRHVNLQEREWWKNHITTCSTCCHSHQKTDWEGQGEAKTGNKIAPALKPGGWPTACHRSTAVWTKARKITGHCPEFTFLRKLAQSSRKRSEKILEVSVHSLCFEEASAGDVGPSLTCRSEALEARLELEGAMISFISLLTKQRINRDDVWKIILAAVRGKVWKEKWIPETETQIYQVTGHQFSTV